MRRTNAWLLAALLVVLLTGSALVYVSWQGSRVPRPSQIPGLPTGSTLPAPSTATGVAAGPYALLSQEAMLATIDALASIEPYSGWRNSASEGEAQALDTISQALDGLSGLQAKGMEQVREGFDVPLATEMWDSGLDVVWSGTILRIPASGLRGPRSDAARAANFDSDGVLTDTVRNPVVVEGPVTCIRSHGEVDDIPPRGLEGQIVLLDFAVIDPLVRGSMEQAASTASAVLARAPAALVLVTQFSGRPGESHGSFAGDGGVLSQMEAGTLPPTLHVRLEDLAASGVAGWDELALVERATLRWDADVLSPASSENLFARIPGRDPSKVVVLGAHIDSTNNPGAMDDASGSAILLEVARVLDASGLQPPTDLYLAWFGSEELGLLGSTHFAEAHPDVMGRTIAMLQIDCLTHPLEGIDAELALVTWSDSPLGEERLSWPTSLAQAAHSRGVTVGIVDVPDVYSDNHVFGVSGVPNADLIYMNEGAMEATGSLHYAAHIHDPYDTVELARQEGGVLEQMARVALAAALEPVP